MMSWFRKMLPREDRFFDLFERHSRVLVAAAEALEKLLAGHDIAHNTAEISRLEDEADHITAEVMLAVRRSFITPFDRGDIKDLIQSMDDAIDMMRKTVKTVGLFEQTSFEPNMRDMGPLVVQCARLVAEALPLLSALSKNAARLTELAEAVVKLEEQSDTLYDEGLKALFVKHGKSDPMGYVIGAQIYAELEKVIDRFEDVANEISGIVIENV